MNSRRELTWLGYFWTVNDWKVVQALLRTPHLDLHHICAEDLITLYEEPENTSIYEGKPYRNPHRHLVDNSGPLGWRVPQVRVDPTLNRWFLRWIVLRSSGEIIGSTSFHGAPNESGMIEIGLGIEELFRNRGFAKEAVLAMWRWALLDPQIKVLRYTVGVTNAPSIHVIESFGFHYQGEQIDDEDGPESIYEMSREEFLEKFGAESENQPMISRISLDVRVSANKYDLAGTVCDSVISKISEGLSATKTFHLALTGGSLGILICELLVARWNETAENYSGLHLWWGDERFVPEASEERNAHPVLMGLNDDSPIHVHQVLPSDSGVNVDVAATRYNADLFGIAMDLTLLGVGPDGHVASLFPGQWDENVDRNATAVHNSPKPPLERVSLTMSKINESKAVWFVVSGSDKHDAVRKMIARDADIPATYAFGKVETLLFADLAAFTSE